MEINFYDKAMDLHQKHVVVDCHLDLGGIVYNRKKDGESNILNHLFYDDMKAGGFNFIVGAIFIETEFAIEMALKVALLQIAALKKDVEACSNHFMMVYTQGDMDRALAADKIGIILSLEGAEPVQRDLDLLDTFYDLGVRGMGLTWSRRNFAADGSYFKNPEEGIRGGLTPFGIQLVKRADQLGIFLDISHINDAGAADVFDYSNTSIIASHSNARSCHNIPRNLTDSQIRKVSETGGVIGINTYVSIVSDEEEKQNINTVCNHIEHIIKVSSSSNVGFGFDLCAKYYNKNKRYDVLESHEDAVLITAELMRRGYSDSDLKSIIGGNLYRLLKARL